MRNSFIPGIVLAGWMAVGGCTKHSALPESPANRLDTATATVVVKGNFSNGPYGTVSGRVTIYSNGNNLAVGLENFSSSAGPDLKVYLSREKDPVRFVNLGSLRSLSGNQAYDCPPGTDTSEYKYVLIYCQQYKHLFGSATL